MFTDRNKRSARRKTLSHLELDDFLRESDNVLNSSSGSTCSEAANDMKPKKKRITLAPPLPASMPLHSRKSVSAEQIRETLLTSPTPSTLDLHPIDGCPPEQSLEALVRLFCSAKGGEEISLARRIHGLTSYPLLPARVLFPEQFDHPPFSYESKRELLLSLSPSLIEAEKERKDEEEERVDFTRCRVGKASRKSNAHYEYVDVDTNTKVAASEYETRFCSYSFFISRLNS